MDWKLNNKLLIYIKKLKKNNIEYIQYYLLCTVAILDQAKITRLCVQHLL